MLDAPLEEHKEEVHRLMDEARKLRHEIEEMEKRKSLLGKEIKSSSSSKKQAVYFSLFFLIALLTNL